MQQQQEWAKDVKEQGKLLIRLEERLERMDHDLFGYGQPGKIETMEKDIQALQTKESGRRGMFELVVGLAVAAELIYHVVATFKHL
jgi:hypothetical protein